MRSMKTRLVLGTVVAVAAAIGLGATLTWGTLPKMQEHDKEEFLHACSDATLNGTYALTFSGFTTRGAVPATIDNFSPVAGGGLVTFEGNGILSASETVSNGGIINPVNVPGTYTVNSDCTGTFTTAHAHLNLVIIRNGREIQAVNTDPGNVVLDNFVRR